MRNVFVICMLLFAIAVCAQDQKPNAKVDANGNFVALKSNKRDSTNTGKFFITDKEKLPVYSTKKGALFVGRVSKKTGKYYRQYIKT